MITLLARLYCRFTGHLFIGRRCKRCRHEPLDLERFHRFLRESQRRYDALFTQSADDISPILQAFDAKHSRFVVPIKYKP